MVHLKRIDNPFEEKMMIAISKFYDERSFYDCINRRFLSDQAFQHLEHTFYMYLLTGDHDDWIGYVLFSNENRVNSYYHFAWAKTLDLLNDFKSKFGDSGNKKEFDRLERLLKENDSFSNPEIVLEEVVFSLKKLYILNCLNSLQSEVNDFNKQELEILKAIIITNSYPNDTSIILENILSRLRQLGIPQFGVIDTMFLDYQKQLQEYLLQFPNYFYLDVVIALPKEEEIIIQRENSHSNLSIDLLAELKYYGFIQETFVRVEEEIRKQFQNIPILLGNINGNVFVVNDEVDLSNNTKQLMKQIRELHKNQ